MAASARILADEPSGLCAIADRLTGRDDASMVIINAWAPPLPRNSAFGQVYQVLKNGTHQSCGRNVAHLPTGITQVPDTCDHLHVQVPRGAN